ncbi:MAG: hypothetical protein ACYC27_14630 [Armatimonadota bacterium]
MGLEMSNPYIAAAGMLGSIFAGSKQIQAMKQAAEAIKMSGRNAANGLREAASPYLQEAKTALPAYSKMVFGEYGSKVGQDDPYLKAAHETNMQGIGREKNKALATSNRAFRFNPGRGRGEALRIGQSATEMTNRENLRYGQGQSDYRTGMADKFTGGLDRLVGFGNTGLNLQTTAANMQMSAEQQAAGMIGGAKSEFYGDLGELAGIPMGEYMANQDLSRMKKLYDSADTSKYMYDPITGKPIKR